MENYTKEQLASRITNIRTVENVMSKYAFLTYYKRFDEALGKFWTQNNPTLTTNDKKLTGYAAVRRFLVEQGEAEAREGNETMRKLYPETFADKKTARCGAPAQPWFTRLPRPSLNWPETRQPPRACSIRLAPARRSTRRQVPRPTGSGKKYAVDFVKESDGWKIWHMVIMTDFKTP